jgi:hypothetical protein
MSCLKMSNSPSDALGVNTGICVSSRSGIGTVRAGGPGVGLPLARAGRGVALGSTTSSTTGPMFVSLPFLAATLLDLFDGDRGACDMTGVSAFGVRRRSGGGSWFGVRFLRAQRDFALSGEGCGWRRKKGGWRLGLFGCEVLPSGLLQVVCRDFRVGRRLRVAARIEDASWPFFSKTHR